MVEFRNRGWPTSLVSHDKSAQTDDRRKGDVVSLGHRRILDATGDLIESPLACEIRARLCEYFARDGVFANCSDVTVSPHLDTKCQISLNQKKSYQFTFYAAIFYCRVKSFPLKTIVRKILKKPRLYRLCKNGVFRISYFLSHKINILLGLFD